MLECRVRVTVRNSLVQPYAVDAEFTWSRTLSPANFAPISILAMRPSCASRSRFTRPTETAIAVRSTAMFVSSLKEATTEANGVSCSQRLMQI